MLSGSGWPQGGRPPGEGITVIATERIRGRLVEIESGRVEGQGWIAVGIVKEGLGPEKGMRFETRGPDAGTAEERLRAELEAYFA
jgi:hypothetical protein